MKERQPHRTARPGFEGAAATRKPGKGAKVLIEGERSWSVGTIEDVRPPEDLPEIPGGPDRETVRGILEEMGADLIAIINHGEWLFAAIHANGSWWDLEGQRLKLTPLEDALAEEIRKAPQ